MQTLKAILTNDLACKLAVDCFLLLFVSIGTIELYRAWGRTRERRRRRAHAMEWDMRAHFGLAKLEKQLATDRSEARECAELREVLETISKPAKVSGEEVAKSKL